MYIHTHIYIIYGLLWWLSSKESSCQCRRHGFNPLVEKISRRRKWQTTPAFLPGKSHEHKSLVGYSSVGLQRVKYDLETKQQQSVLHIYCLALFSYLIWLLTTFQWLLKKFTKLSNNFIYLLMCHQAPKENSKLYSFNWEK